MNLAAFSASFFFRRCSAIIKLPGLGRRTALSFTHTHTHAGDALSSLIDLLTHLPTHSQHYCNDDNDHDFFVIHNRRFGFANQEALANGQTGTACRGEEHDITLVWSITSGKRLVLADGQEVHYSSSRGSILDFSWTMRGNHVLKIVAHASPPLSAAPGFRQYDFFVDGQSFFNFPKVFRLGLAPGDPRGNDPSVARGGGYAAYAGPGNNSTRSASSTGIVSLEAPRNVDEVRTGTTTLNTIPLITC